VQFFWFQPKLCQKNRNATKLEVNFFKGKIASLTLWPHHAISYETLFKFMLYSISIIRLLYKEILNERKVKRFYFMLCEKENFGKLILRNIWFLLRYFIQVCLTGSYLSARIRRAGHFRYKYRWFDIRYLSDTEKRFEISDLQSIGISGIVFKTFTSDTV
jgi:hypothetical protein